MSFRCASATLEQLEWPRLLRHLAAEAATERGAAACLADRFQPDALAMSERLVETSEARGLLDAGEPLPFAGVSDLRPVLAALGRGSAPSPADLARVLDCARASRRMRGFLLERAERAPRLAGLAETLGDLHPLERRLERALDPSGGLRDDASPALADARREVRRLRSEVERRMARYLKDPQVVPHLQDHYSTFREERPVLPVRAEARRHVPGILHDVSSSGTTVFIEPEEVVELSNRLRLAEREEERESERLLRALGAAVAAERLELEAQGGTLEKLDVALASGRLSRRLDAAEPLLDAEAPIALAGLRHPLLLLDGGLDPADVVANDVRLPEGARALVISGPNAGGKTVLAKALGLAALSARAGLHVPCEPGSRLPPFDAVFADIGDAQDLRAGLSTFSARMSNLGHIVGAANSATLVIVDEVGEGTEPGEGAALAQALLEALVGRGAHVVATTHFNRLKELAGADERFCNASAAFDVDTLLPTYRVHLGVPGSSGATFVAERMGVAPAVVERARALLDREDRRLEALTRGLSELRQELEGERRLVDEVRRQTEGVRAEYEARLATLRSAREQALAAMKADLETAYRSAKREIGDVVRALQRGGAAAGPAANRAQRRLGEIRRRTEQVEGAHADVLPREPEPALDWGALAPGARLRLRGVRGEAVLVELPDRRGRVAVRVGGARMTVAAARVSGVASGEPPAVPPSASPAVEVERSADAAPGLECDLRGLRVDEALDRAQGHLDRLLGGGQRRIRFIHGHGTGALRSAVRAWLRERPEVADFEPGSPAEGGNGVTVVTLVH